MRDLSRESARAAPAQLSRPEGEHCDSGCAMNWLADRLLLIVTALIVTAAGWAIISATGEWFPLLMTVTAFASLWIENSRLRKLLEQNGIDPRRRKR
ncbi:hypothetical protein [Burkholderia sola]|uniref:hypothetical protein n=1 Tax=Burkholderia sola TaxID=2843302 RepID=UPI00209AC234